MADTSVYDKVKTFDDYRKADEAYQLQRQLAASQMQTGAIDALSKKNVFATQVLTAAAAGGQDQYANTLAKLQAGGFGDIVGNFSPDVNVAANQLQQARLSQSPLGTLLNASQKQQGNAIQLAGLTGEIGPDARNPLAALSTLGGVSGGLLPQASVPVQQPRVPPAQQVFASQPQMANAQATVDLLGGSPTPVPGTSFNSALNAGDSASQLPGRAVNETMAAYKTRLENDPSVIANQAKAKTMGTETGKVEAERSAGYTRAQSALQGFEQQSKLVTDTIDKAIELIDKSPTATGYGQYLSVLPNTDSRALNNYLDTIKANVGFDKLQNMRDNSPTGGALGQVSDTENRLLQAVNGALDPKQGQQLKENLATIKSLYPQVLAERQRAFSQDYGKITPVGNNPITPSKAPNPTADLIKNAKKAPDGHFYVQDPSTKKYFRVD